MFPLRLGERARRILDTVDGKDTDPLAPPVHVHPDVAKALRDGTPVVALESTIISHGMPYPQNLETAQSVEQVIRENGAVPATIAILDGVIHVGLESANLAKLAQLGPTCHKTSRRDVALVVSQGTNGATTVSGTVFVANMVGIRVFVTGGIGGVHRGGENSMDISADLTELGRSAVAVVCAGAKSLLDIGRSLEYLETQGVTVVGYGTNDFPAFFTPSSGFHASCRLDTPLDVAKLIQANLQTGLESGMVIGVPIPKDKAAEFRQIEAAIHQSLEEARERGITGRDVTPYLLQRINELTGGDSLRAIVHNNAEVGAKIAVELSKLMTRQVHE